VAGLQFCPSCGLNTADAGDRSARPAGDRAEPPVDAVQGRFDAVSPTATPPGASTSNETRSVHAVTSSGLRSFVDRGPRGSSIVIGAVIVAAGLIVFGLLMRPQPGGNPAPLPGDGVAPGGSAASTTALIVGLTIQSPQDGQSVATKEVTVIGVAPPGLSITRDVSFGLDQHATADGTGHWAMSVGLDQGENKLVFRIGDDHSTEQKLRVIYTPPAP
jgi:hypothetical protein